MTPVSEHDRPARAQRRAAQTEPKVFAAPDAPEVSAEPDKADAADARLQQVLETVLGALDDLKANDVQVLDVRGKTSIADTLVIASGTSNRHVASLADEVTRQAKALGVQPLGVEGTVAPAEWVLVDLGDIIVHVMLPRVRAYYGLERLWLTDATSADEAGVDADAAPDTAARDDDEAPADYWTARVERRRRYRD